MLGTLRDMRGSVHRRRVMSCIGKMLDTPFPPLPGWISNYVEDTNCIDSQPESSFPPARVVIIFCPDFIGYLTISGSMWIKATAPSPP